MCLGEASFMYILKRVGDRTEPCGTPACISLGVDISPSTEWLNFHCERIDPVSLIRLVENPYCHYIASAPTTQKTASVLETCLPNHCIAMVAVRTSYKTSPVITTSPAHWRTELCLATTYNHFSYCWAHLREMFIAPLPSYTCYNIIIRNYRITRWMALVVLPPSSFNVVLLSFPHTFSMCTF
jgi:hypothetical protein